MSPRIDPLDEREARYQYILARRGEGMLLEEIGAEFTPPLTKERVRQILAKPPRPAGRPPKKPRREGA